MSTIERIELIEIRLPLVEPFQISSGVQRVRRILLIRVEDAQGASGWGECVAGETPNYSPETVDGAWHMIEEWVAPRILGVELEEPCQIRPLLEKDFRGHNMAKAGVEMACWALFAQERGVSLARLLGGVREKIEVGISIGIQPSPEMLVEKVRRAVQEGYRKIKAKIMPGADLEYVRAVRDQLGQDVPLMVDANNAYTLQDLPTLQALDEFGLIMIEQPLAWDDLVRHGELQKHLRTPVCLDESITGLDRVQDMVTLGAGRIVNIKPGRVGGHASSREIHDYCASQDIPVWCGGMLESGIGRAHNVALASLENFRLPGDVSPSSRYWERDIVSPAWSTDGQGRISVPRERPGLGVEIDHEFIDATTTRRRSLAKS
ncbi:MAG TPA: o-succinylbenzoate synthase [Acidobacteriota bacterium]|nr:o-succinylbenzoate synthase [Acidobacteriota bacterium]